LRASGRRCSRGVFLVGRLRPEEVSSILKSAITDYESRVRTE
jgi:hypothetical protein